MLLLYTGDSDLATVDYSVFSSSVAMAKQHSFVDESTPMLFKKACIDHRLEALCSLPKGY